MPRLPDVQSLGPRATARPRDLVLAPPPNIIDAASNASLQTQAGDYGDQAAQRIYTRQDAIERARIAEEYSAFADETARTFQTERDLTSQATVNEYANLLKQKEAELLGTHRGSADSRANLQIKLGDVRSRYAGTFAGESIRAQRQRATDFMQTSLNSIASDVYDIPDSYDDARERWLIENREMSGAFSQEEEFANRVGGLSEITLSSALGYLDRGQYEKLDTFLARPDVIEVLSTDDMRQLRMRKQAAISAEAESSREFDAWMATLAAQGITPTRAEVLQRLGGYVAPQSPQVVVNNGGEAGPVLSRDGQSVLTPDPADPSGYRFVPIGGGEAAAAAQAAAEAALSGSLSAGDKAESVVTAIEDVFSILEDPGILPAAGPLTGPLTSFIPGTAARQAELYLDTVRANVGFGELQAMRDASPTGGALGQVSENENRLLQSLQGNLTTEVPPEKLAETLERIGGIFARTAYGSDQELDAAVAAGNMTPAEAAASVDAREAMIGRIAGRAQALGSNLQSRQAASSVGIGGRATNAATPPAGGVPASAFTEMLDRVRSDPRSVSLEEVQGMGFSQDQLDALANAYDRAVAGQRATGGADGQIDPALIDEIAAFAERTPDAGQYFEAMADILDAADEAGRQMTLEEAFAQAKAATGG